MKCSRTFPSNRKHTFVRFRFGFSTLRIVCLRGSFEALVLGSINDSDSKLLTPTSMRFFMRNTQRNLRRGSTKKNQLIHLFATKQVGGVFYIFAVFFTLKKNCVDSIRLLRKEEERKEATTPHHAVFTRRNWNLEVPTS